MFGVVCSMFDVFLGTSEILLVTPRMESVLFLAELNMHFIDRKLLGPGSR